MKTTTLRRFESDYDRVMKKPTLQLGPTTILAGIALALVLVTYVVLPLGKRAWSHLYETINPPVLTFNPYDRVVKVTEADGTVLTIDSGARFHDRVSEIRQKGVYEKVYTGRLDGRP